MCGAGTSALAHLLAGRGAQVSGSDVKTGEAAAGLERAGCRVRAGHDASVGSPGHLRLPRRRRWRGACRPRPA
ncbi:Mur ligase domain-containing protein [Streptomyces sp. NPDC048604]|uniref:Mur ligase domain-containing protein n=1 Tax=Streptomyces sp. NPDC048604 TaxID=3365578 RepID=UPI0037193165